MNRSLFLDPDVFLVQEDTIKVMLNELDESKDTFSYDWNAEDIARLKEKRRDELLSEYRRGQT